MIILNENGSETTDDGTILNKIGNNIITNAFLYALNGALDESSNRNNQIPDDHNLLYQGPFGKSNIYNKLSSYQMLKPTDNHLRYIIEAICN